MQSPTSVVGPVTFVGADPTAHHLLRQSTKRRSIREAATALPERNGTAVPDSAWDRALAAVHEEVAKLPDTLRVPFVLCCLEGKGQTEAAEQLGWNRQLGGNIGEINRW